MRILNFAHIEGCFAAFNGFSHVSCVAQWPVRLSRWYIFFCLLHDTTWTWRAYGVRDHQPFFFTLHRAPTASQHVYVGSSITKYCSRAGHMCRTGILFLLVAFDSIHTAVGYTYTAFVLRRSKKGTIKDTKSNATEQCLKGKPNIND